MIEKWLVVRMVNFFRKFLISVFIENGLFFSLFDDHRYRKGGEISLEKILWTKFNGQEFKLERLELPENCELCDKSMSVDDLQPCLITFEDGTMKWACNACSEIAKRQKLKGSKVIKVKRFNIPSKCPCGTMGSLWCFGQPYRVTYKNGKKLWFCPRCGSLLELLGLVKTV